MKLLQDRTAAFVVRLWCESDEADGLQPWRGFVEHVQSGRRAYFQRYDDLATFLQASLDADMPRSAEGDAAP